MKRKNLYKFTLKFAALLAFLNILTAFSPSPRKIYFQNLKSKKIDSALLDFYGNTQINQLPSGMFRVSFYSKTELLNDAKNKKSLLPIYNFNSNASYHFDNQLFIQPVKTELNQLNITKTTNRTTKKVLGAPLSSPKTKVGVIEIPSRVTEVSEDVSLSSMEMKEMSTAKAGVVTAGRWSDLENWTKFQKTHEDPAINSIQKQWGFDLLDNRVSVKLTNQEGLALALQKIQLRNSKDSIIWSCITDNSGTAELWINPFEINKVNTKEKFGIYYLNNERWEFLGKVSGDVNSIEEYRLNKLRPKLDEVDVCFVMDATGSMGDEIQYLQKELIYFALNANKELPCSNVRLSSVFYRDLGDEYISKTADFTNRVEDILGFISEQSAGGGGDFPEAVDMGLNSAINELNWSNNSVAKIIFLVLDAPPHFENAIKIRELTKKASQKGIKIIPITASGINTSTEFLMKYMASITGGEYLYITDHSGVGNSHIKPTGVKENVDLLKNQWINVLLKYAKYGDCDKMIDSQQIQPTVDPRRNIFGNQEVVLETYPNPAINYIDIESNTDILGIKLYDVNHRLILEVKNEQISKKKRFEFPVQVPGLYLLEVNTKGGNFINKTLLTNGYRS
jgi:hypothetical protein